VFILLFVANSNTTSYNLLRQYNLFVTSDSANKVGSGTETYFH